MMETKIGIWKDSKIFYPQKGFCFRPSERYLELQNTQLRDVAMETNKVYEAIRNTFIMLG